MSAAAKVGTIQDATLADCTMSERNETTAAIGKQGLEFCQVGEISDGSASSKFRYRLRDVRHVLDQSFGSFLDSDFSGNYDPTSKAPIQKYFPIRPWTEGNPRKPRPADAEPTGPPSLQACRRMGLQFPVKLCFKTSVSEITWKTEIGKAVKAILETSRDNWPQEIAYHDITELSAEDLRPQRLRDRTKSNTTAESSDTGFSWRTFTLGHPEFRGCKACAEVGFHCELIKGQRYPCSHCEEEDEECDVVTEPLQKQMCAKCSRRRIVCSFRDSTDHQGPCKQCKDKGFHCIAGPKNGYTRNGPSLDDPLLRLRSATDVQRPDVGPFEGDANLKMVLSNEDPGFTSGTLESDRHPQATSSTAQKRKDSAAKRRRRRQESKALGMPTKCLACKRDKKHCSLYENPGKVMCGYCKKNGLDCVFESVEKRIRAASAGDRAEMSPTPEVEIVAARPNLPRHVVYGHRIDFMLDNSGLCSWCGHDEYGHQLYGLVGPPSWFPLIYELLTGQKAEEPTARTASTVSKMCWECTAARLEILSCSKHVLHELTNCQSEFSGDNIACWLRPDWISMSPWQWCSICPKPAGYECRQCSFTDLRQGRAANSGCGLLLCEECARELVLDCDHNLTTLVRRKEGRIWNQLDLRADANFLRADGKLTITLAETCRK